MRRPDVPLVAVAGLALSVALAACGVKAPPRPPGREPPGPAAPATPPPPAGAPAPTAPGP